jgi:hypothetical protein
VDFFPVHSILRTKTQTLLLVGEVDQMNHVITTSTLQVVAWDRLVNIAAGLVLHPRIVRGMLVILLVLVVGTTLVMILVEILRATVTTADEAAAAAVTTIVNVVLHVGVTLRLHQLAMEEEINGLVMMQQLARATLKVPT